MEQGWLSAGDANVTGGQIGTAKLAKIVGHEREQSGQVYKITVGRDDLDVKEMRATINHARQ